MPVQWLTEVEHDRLRGFPSFISPYDLLASFTLTEADRRLVLGCYGAGNQLGTALQVGDFPPPVSGFSLSPTRARCGNTFWPTSWSSPPA